MYSSLLLYLVSFIGLFCKRDIILRSLLIESTNRSHPIPRCAFCAGLFVCLYVCLYVCMSVCLSVCMSAYVYVSIHPCTYRCMYTYLCMYISNMNTSTSIRKYTYVCHYTHTHTHNINQTHKCTHKDANHTYAYHYAVASTGRLFEIIGLF